MKCKIIYIGLLISLFTTSGCESWVDGGPPKHGVKTEDIFKDVAGLNAAIAGMYTIATNSSIGMLSVNNGLLADDLVTNVASYEPYETNSLVSNEWTVASVWTTMYAGIYRANAIIKGVEEGDFEDEIKRRALGEAHFMRSLWYFHMVNLFGDAPLITGLDLDKNKLAPRGSVASIYDLIVADLKAAVELLPPNYSVGKIQRVRANKWAATALLARVYLYLGKYSEAESLASDVIEQNGVYKLSSNLNSVFTHGSDETIFAIDVSLSGATYVGSMTIPNPGTTPAIVIHPTLLSLFEAGDKRKIAWIGFSAGQDFLSKFKVRSGSGNEYDVVLRLPEQYLIRAEARAQLENIQGAEDDINKVRQRANVSNVKLTDKNQALLAVEKERRMEYFGEWSHRWFDLKRTGKVNEVIGAIKPETWKSTGIWYPIPSQERKLNVNLTQNDGYE
ncbi:MAG: RagB/SusD family nutrient uptake outer membrane protein [Sphingobacterium sp.]|jgi:tetratricopeptide (TPR) repeat protein|nr:RagB/SusD family nutrient uptake outer membrane protein [Sphingobacterium sp.]